LALRNVARKQNDAGSNELPETKKRKLEREEK
jgi:hypothetical protein